jgi:superfamily II DNA or RNA helicase
MPSAFPNTQRESLPDVMTFRKTWRVYQSRLLDHLDGYLQNNRLHLVAAPGSGKTVLGLEVIRRVNQPTLVLAPTITIRDQWVDRLVDLFLPLGSSRPAWVSTELRSPAFLTIATYQALHAVCSGEPEEQTQPIEAEEKGDSRNHELEPLGDGADANHGAQGHVTLPEAFTAEKFRALVPDEAHHLRAEWWKTLTSVAAQLDKPTIIALDGNAALRCFSVRMAAIRRALRTSRCGGFGP